MTRLEKLLMRVEMIDKITAPANKATSAVNKLIDTTKTGYLNIAGGVAGIWGTGLAFQNLTTDYREFHKEVMGVKTLGVADDTLKKLERTALGFSIRYGQSAASFVNSSYEIQSAIAGLTGDELIRFTEAGNILAKGAKADAATITNYMGTMYGIFQNQADAMGRAQWIEQLTGQTSMAVDIFKSDGMQMSAAFTSLGADAQAHGIAINEQMAVLGQLQATMSGSEAGTKYKAFLRGVGAAQKELGIQFTDSAGRMLPVSNILTKLQGKFGAIDTVAKSDALKKAFGSDEAVATIKLLLNNTTGLADAITEIGNVKGMDQAIWKAQQLADPLERINNMNKALKISFGALIEKALLPFYEFGIKNGEVLNAWINKYPHLFGLIAKATIVIMGFTAVISALAIMKGLAIIAMAGFSAGLMILKTPLLLIRLATWSWNAALVFTRAALLATAIRFPMVITGLIAMKAGFIAGATSAWAFAAALLANPITWIVVGVVALIAGLVMLVKNWDSVKVAAAGAINWMVEKWQVFRTAIESNPVLKFIFAPLLAAADVVGLLIKNLDKIPQWFSSFKNWLAELNVFDVLMAPVKGVLDMLNLLPGVNIDTSKLQSTAVPKSVQVPPALQTAPAANMPRFAQAANTPAQILPIAPIFKEPVQIPFAAQITAPAANDSMAAKIEAEKQAAKPAPMLPVNNVPQGGLMQQITNNNRNNSNSQHIDTVNITTQQINSPQNLRDELLMSVG